MNAPDITLNHVSLSFNDHPLFHNLSCQFTGGQFTCLLGPSGVGKSSLLKLIAGLTHSSSVFLQEIAYMSQGDSLLPWLTILDNVLLGARLRGEMTVAKKQHALALLKRVDLKNPTQHVEELSGGMRQRVALVRTLLENKPIVLMDEPFSALDVITRLDLQDLAAELLKDKTVLLVTHDPLEALRLGHDIYILSGSPVQLGEPIVLNTPTPRSTTTLDILALQGQLLARLQHAQDNTR